jgi:hypothetical protein
MRRTSLTLTTCVAALVAGPAIPQDSTSYSLYGTPGLLEMPNARSGADAEIGASFNGFMAQQRVAFTFQVLPRLSGTFRYSGLDDREDGIFDRSFDLRYRILDEGDFTPAVAVGLQDFLGTGYLASEYIVASKRIGDRLDVTAGLGWGRLGTRNGVTNPLGVIDSSLEDRPDRDFDDGGKIEANQFFKGDMGIFGGVAYRYSDRLTLKAEYSSDDYVRETEFGSVGNNSPINVGLSYRYYDNVELNLAYLYGSELAAGVTLTLNPRERMEIGGIETAPVPVPRRPADTRAAATWGTDEPTLVAALADEGIRLDSYDVSADTMARVRYTNLRYRSEAQALGRTARVLAANLPAPVETIVLEPMQNGMPLSATTVRRSDLENFETAADGAALIQSRSPTTAAGTSDGLTPVSSTEDPAFQWSVGPYAALIVFNGNAPVQLDVGLEAKARYRITPGLFAQGAVRQSALGERELAEVTETPNSYPNVRTDGDDFGTDGYPVIENLTLAHYGRVAPDVYTRVTAGYLERMYGGVSTELLWKPVDSNLAIGAEVNYARLRDTDMLLGFQDFEAVTGHISAYYNFDNGFHTQVSVGQYLAGDAGVTFALDREFENGWSVGGYFTLTDMPFEEFGEGSFDKGIRVTVPVDYFFGNATRREVSADLASLQRDGGARLNMDGRLYDIVRDGHTAGGLGDTFGRFWR